MKDQIENQKESSKEISMSRRKFLKKTGYAAPSLVVLGSLTRPSVAFGSDTNTGPGGGYGGGNGFGGGNGNGFGGG